MGEFVNIGQEEDISEMVRKVLTVKLVVALLIPALFGFVSAGTGFAFVIQPYVQNVDKTSATILWKPAGDPAGHVEYGETAAYGSVSEGSGKYIVKNGRERPDQGSVVRTRLVGLLPDRAYRYRVVLSSSASENRTFRTAPANGDAGFTFLVYGDSRSDPPVHARVASAAATLTEPAFVLGTGDSVSSNSSGQLIWGKEFFGPADPLLRKTWFLLTRGNHDKVNRFFPLHFEMPGDNRVPGACSFNWGPVHVVTINTNKDYRPGSEQYAFLERDLDQASTPFKVFFGHHPAYSSGFHGSTKKMQKYLQPLFEEKNVKLVFAGHEHAYERTIVNGVTYVVSGGGGAPLHGQGRLNRNPSSLLFKKAHHFVEVNAASSALTLTAWEVGNDGMTTVIDQAVITP